MTREEAIRILDNLKPTNTKSSFDAYVVGEAITMAIKALEQEPCEDATLKDIFCMGCEYKEQEPVIEPLERLSESASKTAKALERLKEQEPILDKIRAEIDGIEINGQVDEHTSFIRTGEQVKQMAFDIIDKYRKEQE